MKKDDCSSEIHVSKDAKVDGKIESGIGVFHSGATLLPASNSAEREG